MSKKDWGNISWILMHSLAQKVTENKFVNCKEILIRIIFDICNNLPCPDCREHAIKLLKSSNIHKISNKKQLISFLCEFHNIVNKKLKKPTKNIEEVEKQYSTAKLNMIVTIFFRVYNSVIYNEKMIADSFRRKIFLKKLLEDLIKLKPYINN
tara:strand:+ start:6391 stop:6849 length:459 start_codon:yes stop_codon:yes gene_type:complete